MSATAVLPEKPRTAPESPPHIQELSDTEPYRWTCDEYHRMTELGFFDERSVELLDGEILRMPAQLTPHAVAVGLTRRVVEAAFGAGYDVRIQAPITLSRHSEPEPDVLIALGVPTDYISHHPGPAEIALLVEVSDRTLRKDCGRKARAYARAGITDYWIVNLVDRRLEVHRDPQPDGRYLDVKAYGPEEAVSPLALPDVEVRVADLMPPEA